VPDPSYHRRVPSGLSRGVKLVYVVLLANGLPAFFLLMSFPGRTNELFVWTVHPTPARGWSA